MTTFLLHGEIETPRPLRAPSGNVYVTGWCVIAGVSIAPPVRLVTEAGVLPLSSCHERADVQQLLANEPAAARCGFTISGRLPTGVHLARFEAQTPSGHWQIFRQYTLAVESAPFIAVLDEPISEGTLRDRVKVGGWALDLTQPVRALSLRYGHRAITCVINRQRQDVAEAFPVPHAGRAGFITEDFLVAGHGPVRVRAQLADGRTVIAATKVNFSVTTDENHGPELDLTAARIGLDDYRVARLIAPPAPTIRPLNLLFILPGSFTSNHALHVAALANELVAAGHACAVAVAHDLKTMAHLDRPAFRGMTHTMAENDPDFADKRGPDIVHVWTTSENVRILAEKLRSRHQSRIVVHLEDNEQQVLALATGRTAAELLLLPDRELDHLVTTDRSHPRLSRGFLIRCDGVSVITSRLREFVPIGKPCLSLPPAADERHYYPRLVPESFRAALQLAPDTTLLLYPGNVHASNAAEVRELYAAVLELNRTGVPVLLIRAGQDGINFLGELAHAVAPYVLELGQILHHRHLPPLMALADIFVQPGWPDAFNDYRLPSKLPEFFSIGRPVVLPRTNLGTTLRHGIDAYVLEQADAAGIATAVRELRTDRALYDRLAQGATAYAAQHFSWRRSADKLAKFYQTLGGAIAPVTSTPPPPRLLITGGRGRLAALITQHFTAQGYPITRFSRQSGDDMHAWSTLTEPAQLAGAGTLLHLAWSTLPATSEKSAGAEWQDDLPALEKILQALTQLAPAERPHFIFFSSGGAVYGNAPGRPNLETDQCQPIGWYGKAKRAAEELIEGYVASHGLTCTLLRISNPYGYPVPKNRLQGIIPHAIRCAAEGQTLTLWGDGHAQKDFLHYTDFLAALEQVITRRLTGTFNLSAGESHTVREVIALVEQQMGKKIAITYEAAPTWDVEASQLDNHKIMTATHWRPQVPLAEGIRRSVADYRAS